MTNEKKREDFFVFEFIQLTTVVSVDTAFFLVVFDKEKKRKKNKRKKK